MDLNSLLFSFKGRIGRLQYLLAILGVGLTGSMVMLPFLSLAFMLHAEPLTSTFALATVITLGIAMAWAGLALQVKRLQDRDRNWYFILVSLIPFIGPLWLAIETYFVRGTVGDNRFGPDPLAPRA